MKLMERGGWRREDKFKLGGARCSPNDAGVTLRAEAWTPRGQTEKKEKERELEFRSKQHATF